MERNNHLMRGSMCCCCGAVLPSPFFIRIGNFRRVCVQCGNEIVSALKYRKDLFDNKLPVLAVVETPNGFERMVVAEENAYSYFSRFDALLRSKGINPADAYKIVRMSEDIFTLIGNEAYCDFEDYPFFHRSYTDYYEIAEMMAINSTGKETEEDMKRLMLASWKAVAKSRLDNVDDIYYQGDWLDEDDPLEFFMHKLWVPFPDDEDSLMDLYYQMLYKEDIQRTMLQNAKWQKERKQSPITDEY